MFHIKNFLAGCVEFRVQGLPLSCLNKLRTYQIRHIRVYGDTFVFQAPLAQAALIKNLLSNFEYQVTENYNLFRGVNFLLNHFVLVTAVLAALAVFVWADWHIYRIQVRCDDVTFTPAVYEYLNQIGVKKFVSKQHLRQANLADNLVENFSNVAHAYVHVAGNTLVVDLVTADNHAQKVKRDVYAQYDAVIKEVTVYSGTALVSPGDVVHKGDLLVTNAYPDSVVVTGEVAFVHGDEISRLVIWII